MYEDDELPFEEDLPPTNKNKIFSVQIKSREDARAFAKRETNAYLDNASRVLMIAQTEDNPEIIQYMDVSIALRLAAAEGDFEKSLFLCSQLQKVYENMSYDWITNTNPLIFGGVENKIEAIKKMLFSQLLMIRSFHAVFYRKFPQSTWTLPS